MSKLILRWFNVEDWKRGLALVILWCYAYQLIVWPILWWAVAIANAYGVVLPLPPIIPWEQLAAGTGTLAAVGGLQKWGERGTYSGQQIPAGGSD